MNWLLFMLAALPGLAADPVQLALATRAQSDFDGVQLSPAPSLVDAARCVQSQAAVLPVTGPGSLPLIHFRQGYCALTGALLAGDRRGFEDAAHAFEQSLAARVAQPRRKNAPPEPECSGVVALAAIARLAAGAWGEQTAEIGARLDGAMRSAACPGTVMQPAQCREILAAAAAWQGWMAVRQNRLADAAGLFPPAGSPGWSAWVTGRQAFERQRYREAAQAYGRAVEAWTVGAQNRTARIPSGLDPAADLASALTDLGGARIASGDARAAVPALDLAVRRDPNRAWAWFLRGRARELTGDPGGALADYNFAGRTALAAAGEYSAGEGRFYRGIWNFRRGDAGAAEAEFAEALNAGLPSALAADGVAWRLLAAVTAGACGASREKLESAVAAASPFFPRLEARTAVASCGTSAAPVGELH